MDMIVAADKNWGIGKDGGLLCHIPGDLRYFKEKTLGATCVMGRKTLDSLPGGKPLPERRNIVLTRSKDFEREGVTVVHDVDELEKLLAAEETDSSGAPGEHSDVFVIGGASIYKELLGDCRNIYVTRMDKVFDADTFFPDLDNDGRFELACKSDPHEENGIVYRFTKYVNREF